MSGVRSVKIADGLKHEYVTQNGHVVRDTVTNASTGAFQYMLDFTYDESGHPLTMRRYKNEAQSSYNTYHYVVNGQGDVVKLLHGTNTTVAEYTYDAWGNVLTATGNLADINPLRYRGYYCDTETGFYYLQSRYYDPAVRRFLNADIFASTGQGFLGCNMFAYCNNNPVICCDQSGHRPMNQSFMIADTGGSFIPLASHPYITPDFVQFCQYHGYSYNEGYDYYYHGPVYRFTHNDDPKYCEDHFFSFYKGKPVFNVKSELVKKMGLSSWSFGIIVINNKKGTEFEPSLRHEYGHTVQMSDLGPVRYFVKVAVPSIIYNVKARGNAERPRPYNGVN